MLQNDGDISIINALLNNYKIELRLVCMQAQKYPYFNWILKISFQIAIPVNENILYFMITCVNATLTSLRYLEKFIDGAKKSSNKGPEDKADSKANLPLKLGRLQLLKNAPSFYSSIIYCQNWCQGQQLSRYIVSKYFVSANFRVQAATGWGSIRLWKTKFSALPIICKLDKMPVLYCPTVNEGEKRKAINIFGCLIFFPHLITIQFLKFG